MSSTGVSAHSVPVERGVRVGDVRGVVLVVMDLHRLRVDVGLERVEGVGEVWYGKGHVHSCLRGLSLQISVLSERLFGGLCQASGAAPRVRLLAMPRLSEYLLPTEREPPADAEALSHKLMVRAGLIRQVGSGLWSWLPAGWRTHQRVVQIVREEMDAIGGHGDADAGHAARGALEAQRALREFGEELFKLKDRKDADMVLGPTSEEVVTTHAATMIRSYRDLPKILYHFQIKERDEPRPRAGSAAHARVRDEGLLQLRP